MMFRNLFTEHHVAADDLGKKIVPPISGKE
jgi:hypothetical protein